MKQYDSNKNNVKTYYSMAQPMQNFNLVSFDLTTKKREQKKTTVRNVFVFFYMCTQILKRNKINLNAKI